MHTRPRSRASKTVVARSEQRTSMPPPLVIVSHNTWLIPFGAPLMLGRAERLAQHVCGVVRRLSNEAPPDALVVVALQELWAFRTGPWWPVLWLVGALQSALLRAGLVRGGYEPVLLRVLSYAALTLAALVCWLPWPFGLWDPKPQLSRALAAAGVPHTIGLHGASLEPLLAGRRRPPPLMDSGLLLCMSRPADESGFVSFGAGGSSEDLVNKGLLWARVGQHAIICTHMTAERNPAQTAPQRAVLGALAARLLRLPGVEQVLVVGDLNHWQGVCRPTDAPRVDEVLAALASGGGSGGEEVAGGETPLVAERLSGDAPTCYDDGRDGGGSGAPQGHCIDHVVCVRRRGTPPLRRGEACVVEDAGRRVSDHCLLHVTTGAT